MPGGDAGEKTEKATPKKRRDQRKEGNVFQSKDVITVVSLFGSFYMLKLLFPKIYETVRAFMIDFIGYAGTVTDTSQGQIDEVARMVVGAVVRTILPLLLISVVLAVVATGVQTKFLVSSKSVRPQLKRLNPISGIKKLFSLQNIIELIKSILKIIILIAVIYNIVIDDMVQVVRTMDMDITMSGIFMLDMVMKLVIRICMAFLVIAALDFMYQWWEYERKLKMSKHFAVALKYDADRYGAPIVLAKGQDELALRIVRVAEESGVAVIENPPLARGIYASTNLSQEIPQEYYGAVAEVLVYVYKMNNKME